MTAVGIDLGGTQIKAVLVHDNGNVARRELRATRDDGRGSWAETVRGLANELGSGQPVGISAPGLAAPDRRSVAVMPGRMHGIEGLNWTEFLGSSSLVPVTNDAHASLLGEAWVGAAAQLRDAIMLTLGTGVGGAILADGRLLRGHLGRAGHLGHVCLDLFGETDVTGMPGALEWFVGNYSIGNRTRGKYRTTHELIEAVRAADEEASDFWKQMIRALGYAIASFINILDPEAVIVGGGIAGAGDLLFTPLREEIARVEWRPTGVGAKILPAELGEWAGAIGAAREAMLASTNHLS